VVNEVNIDSDETIQSILPIEDFVDDKYLVMSTRDGTVKRTELTEYENVHSGGIIAINLRDGDELIDVELTDGDDEIFLTSRQGQSIRFHETDARAIGRTAMGVRGIRLEDDDFVVSMEVIPAEDREAEGTDETTLKALIITDNGYGKRTKLGEYGAQTRGGKGLITINVSERNGPVVDVLLVRDEDEVMLITDRGQLIRVPVDGISVYSRNTQGVKVMEPRDNEKVVAMARVAEEQEEEIDEAEADEPAEDDGESGPDSEAETADESTPDEE
jgi:DNA gyrase subunit A